MCIFDICMLTGRIHVVYQNSYPLNFNLQKCLYIYIYIYNLKKELHL